MKLRDAQIDNMLDTEGNELTSVRKFGEVLRSAKLIADGYFNDHKAFSVPMRLYEDAGNLVASIDARFAFDPANTVTSLLIKVHYADSEDVLFQSFTNNLSFPLEAGDYDIDAYFKIISTWAGWPNKCNVPETKIRWLHTNRFKAEDLNEQPGPNDGSVDPGGDDSHEPGVPFEVESLLVTASNFNDQRNQSPLKDYYENYPTYGEIESSWDNPEWINHSAWPWLTVNYEFDQPYIVEVKYTEVGSEEAETVYSSQTDPGILGPVPVTAGTESGEPKPRTYFLISIPDDMHMTQYGYNADGSEKEDGMPQGKFEVYFTIPTT